MPSQKSTKSAAETRVLALNVAHTLHPLKKGAFVIALQGNLGSGKTAFAKGFAKGLGIQQKILSPTFLIIKSYEIHSPKIPFKRFVHIDCYRIKSLKELLSLGWKNIIADSGNIVLVEWADMVKSVLPKSAQWIKLLHAGKNKRRVALSKGLTKRVGVLD